MSHPTPGTRLRHAAKHGLGQAARIADPDVADELNTLPSDMAELDMPADTEVVVSGHDDDLVLVEWTDRQGNPRITSIPAAGFAANFQEV